MNMDADKNMSSLENSRSGLTETDGNSSSGEKHKTNCVGNNVVQPDDVEMLINGISSDPSNPDQQLIVTPEMLYKLSKKIAQLTKVIYSLNTRNDDLEHDLQSTRLSYEERLQICQEQLDSMSSNVASQNANLANCDNPSVDALDTKALNYSQNKSQSDDHEMKQELKKTQSKLQHFEHKMKTMEEELSRKNKELENTKAEISSMNKKLETKQNDKPLNKHAGGDKNKAEEPTTDASTQVTSSSDKSKQKIASLENKNKKYEKEKTDMMARLHRVEGENINLRIEHDMMKKDVAELNKEKSALKVELSTARIQFNYDREVNGERGSSKVNDSVTNGNHVKVNGGNTESDCQGRGMSYASVVKNEKQPVDFDDAFVQELMDKIEILTKEKSDISTQLCQEKSAHEELNRNIQRLEQEHKMQLHQLENVNREKKLENNDEKMGKSTINIEASSDGSASLFPKIDQSSQTQSVDDANDLDNNDDKKDVSGICDEYEDSINQLTKDKNDLLRQVNEMSDKVSDITEEHKKELEDNQEEISTLKEKSVKQSMEIAEFKAQVEQLKGDLDDEKQNLQTLQDLENERKEQIEELESTRSNLDELQNKLTEAELRVKASDSERERLSIVLAETNVKVDTLEKEVAEGQTREVDLKVEMGQTAEKLYGADEKYKKLELERNDLKRRVKEVEAKLEVITRSKQAAESTISEKVSHLEKALEEALVEREEILEAADKEIQHTKNIAMETEQKMMDDFEWKLREIEAENREKLKTMEASLASKIKTAQDEYAKRKDEELVKNSIGVRRDFEEKMKIERSTLKEVLTNQNKRDLEAAVDRKKLECDRELRILQKSWEDEQVRLNRDISILQRKADNLPDEIKKATRSMKDEHERLMRQEKRASAKAQEDVKQKCQDEFNSMKDELNGQMVRLREDCANRVADLEKQLDSAHGNRMSSMFQMKEEVEAELSERMDQLRNMYKREIDSQSQKMEEQKLSSEGIIKTLKDSVASQKAEIEELNIYYNQREEEYESKVDELLTRLQEQTTAARKLQDELDSYEWYEEEEEENTGTVKANDSGDTGAVPKANHPSRPPSSRSHHGSHSRPSSTRPTDPQNMNCLPKQNSTGASSGRRHPSGSLEPCVEPENENTNMPILLSPALSKASSGYFPQSSFTSTHSYYSTAEDNNIEEEKTSGDSSPIPSRWMTNGNMSPNNDTLNKIHAENEDQTSKSTPMSIENPYPPPRKERSAEPSRHSSGKNNSGDSESNGTLSSQANSSGATSNSKSEGSSSHTKRTSIKSTDSSASGGATSNSSGRNSEKSSGSNRKSNCAQQ